MIDDRLTQNKHDCERENKTKNLQLQALEPSADRRPQRLLLLLSSRERGRDLSPRAHSAPARLHHDGGKHLLLGRPAHLAREHELVGAEAVLDPLALQRLGLRRCGARRRCEPSRAQQACGAEAAAARLLGWGLGRRAARRT